MLWALLSSAYVIYLYRKLDAESAPRATDATGAGSIDAELAALNERIASLESRLAKSS